MTGVRFAIRLVLVACGILLLAAVPALRPPGFVESFLYLIFFWIALATSWTIFSGFSGYFSFGHGAFFGAGMYATANLAAKLGLPLLWTLPLAGAVATALGVGIGCVVFRVRRLRGQLFALLTLAIGFILATVVRNTPIDGGFGVSLASVEIPKIYDTPASSLYLFGLVLAVASLIIAWAIQRSRLGRGLFAISDDEDVAEVMGIPTFRYKLVALAISCFLAGVAGGLHSAFVSYVTVEETFSITVPLFVMLMSLIGGSRHWLGAAIGATFVTVLNYAFVSGEWALAGRAIVGATLVLTIIFLPHGVMGLIERRRHRLLQSCRNDPPAHEPAPEPQAAVPTAVGVGQESDRELVCASTCICRSAASRRSPV